MESPRLFISCDGDGIGQQVGRAVLSDDAERLALISQDINRGEETIKNWAIASHGTVIEAGGDEATLAVPASALVNIEEMRDKYHSAAGATLSVGVGKKLSQAAKSLMAAKLRGKNQVVFYDDSVEKQVAEATKLQEDKSEAQKIAEEYLTKSVSPPSKDVPTAESPEHSEGEVARLYGSYKAPEPEMTHSAEVHHPLEDEFHAHAEAQERAQRAQQAQKSTDLTELRTSLTRALERLRQQLPVLQQVGQQAPELMQSVLGLSRAVVALAREVSGTDQQIAKALEKALPKKSMKKMLATSMPEGASEAMGMTHTGKAEKEEAEPDEDPETKEGGPLDKKGVEGSRQYHGLKLPVGTKYKGRVKVRHYDGKEGWRSVRAGMIQGQDPGVPIMGHASHPVSSREPGSK